jgi:peptide/nickel transport system substrate-binding protein
LKQAPFNKSPVGNGPFRFVSQQANDRWVFEANPNFPEELGGRPNLDRVVWRVVPDNTAQVTELRTGNADLILAPRAEQFRELDQHPDLRGIVMPSRLFAFVGWNGRRPPFNDARVRKALALAIDRNRIVQGLRGGLGEVGVGPIAPYHWAFDSTLKALPTDRAAARALLAQAGFQDRNGDRVLDGPDGKPFRFELNMAAGNDFQRDIAELIRADLDSVGVAVTTRAQEFGTLIGAISSPERTFDAVIMGWESDFRLNLRDVFHSAELNSPFQLASYRNPVVDSLIDQTARTASREAALPLYKQLQAILLEEQPWTVLYYFPTLAVARERVKGVTADIRGVFVNLPEWWLAQGDSAAARRDSAAITR